MLIEYWLAALYGRAWTRWPIGLALGDDVLLEACGAVAAGERVPAGVVRRVHEFASKVWSRLSVLVLLPGFLVLVFGAVIRPGSDGRDAIAWVLAALGLLATVAALLALMLRLRAKWTGDYLARAGHEAGLEPLPSRASGSARWYDFWVVSAFGSAIFAILLYAGTRTPPT